KFDQAIVPASSREMQHHSGLTRLSQAVLRKAPPAFVLPGERSLPPAEMRPTSENFGIVLFQGRRMKNRRGSSVKRILETSRPRRVRRVPWPENIDERRPPNPQCPPLARVSAPTA